MRVIGTIILVMLTTIFCFNASDLPVIGDPNSAPNSHVTPHYIEYSVTGTLADYRGFDTLWETSVMFVAGMTAVIILTKDKEEKFLKKKKGAKK